METLANDPRTPQVLSQTHTRQLMKWLEIARTSGGIYEIIGGPNISIKELKEELANRPHVPNKQEARLIRQLKAKVGQGKKLRRKEK